MVVFGEVKHFFFCPNLPRFWVHRQIPYSAIRQLADRIIDSSKNILKFFLRKILRTKLLKRETPRPASASRALLRLTPCHRAYLDSPKGDLQVLPASLS